MEGTFVLDLLAPWNFLSRGCLSELYHSHLVRHPMERIFPSEILLRYTIMRKTIAPAIKRQNIFILIFTQRLIISVLPCKGLSQLIINGKALRKMETIPYTSQMMSSVKEPVKFKLNTESPDGLSLLFFSRRQLHFRRIPQYIV